MEHKKKEMISMSKRVGAVIGGIAFVIFGLIPAFYFGSFLALVITSGLSGGPLKPTMIVKVLTIMGAIVGISCVGVVFLAIGAMLGTIIGYVIAYLPGSEEAKNDE
jgi:hypothetical protein